MSAINFILYSKIWDRDIFMTILKDTKILITGGAGFIGTHLAERFCENNQIVLFDNLRRDSLTNLPELKNHPNVLFIQGNVLHKNELYNAMKGCDTVLHLAAIAGVSSYYKEPAATIQVNLLGTMNVLECCRELGVIKVIDFSTSEVYGINAFNVTEMANTSQGPISDYRWTYAVSKLASEQLTLRYGENYGFKAYTVRPFNIYGPRQTGEGAISNFLNAIVEKQPIIINGDGTPIRAWCFIRDCVDAIQRLLENKSISSGTFNIGNPREVYSTLGLARLVCEVAQCEEYFEFRKMERTEIQVRVPNIEKAQKSIHFYPEINLKEGLKQTLNWFLKKRES